MPVSVIWDNEEQTILRYVLEGSWTWAGFRPVVDQAVALSQTVGHRVDIIADLRKSGPLPIGNPFPTLKYMSGTVPENGREALFVIVGGRSFVISLANTFQKVYPDMGARVAFAATIEEAYVQIQVDRAQ